MDVRLLDIRNNDAERESWQYLLRENDLLPESLVDKTFGLFDDGTLIATASRFQNTLKMIAVHEKFRGGVAFNQVLEVTLKDAFLNGYRKLFVYTKKEAAHAFEALGFKTIISGDVYFMERGTPTLNDYLAFLAKKKLVSNEAGAIVMHANPFTNGHLHLIKTALDMADIVYVFVLSEDLSIFSPADRLRLVYEGSSSLPQAKERIVVLPTNDYLVSSQTFPSYFLPDDDQVISAQAAIDATLFKTHIAPTLAIKHRFVGEEPLSHTTDLYNRELLRIFAGSPQLTIIKRLEYGGAPISASRVRGLFEAKDMEAIRPLVPAPTYRYLASLT